MHLQVEMNTKPLWLNVEASVQDSVTDTGFKTTQTDQKFLEKHFLLDFPLKIQNSLYLLYQVWAQQRPMR